uniref:Methyltransferase-like protein 9 n=1 Tax=Cacopsylla melanoneura TaxID=428564 RepID=A0A8D8QSQ6_9HEMI
MTNVTQYIFLSITLTVCYLTFQKYLHNSSTDILLVGLLPNVSAILTRILSEPIHMSHDYYNNDNDGDVIEEYTESSVEEYFNTYMRLEQKYAMRPRYGIARAIYERTLRDEAIEHFDKSTWYTCDPSKLDPQLQTLFTQLTLDEETHQFLNASSDKSNAVFTQLYHSIVKILLHPFLCQTSINGLLRRGSMFVVSTSQFQSLLGADYLNRAGLKLIDLGAGDGATTRKMAPFFERVFATEISKPMKWILDKAGYTVLGLEEWQEQKYDVIACLNLLDRCDTPLQLLDQIKSALLPNGRVLVALSLPYAPYVESNVAHLPGEFLPINSSSSSLELQISEVVSQVFEPRGFSLVTWSKVPYLCEGDFKQAYYWLTDIGTVCIESQKLAYS